MSGRRLRGLQRAAAAVNRWDVATSERIAATGFPPAIEHGLPLLTRSADKSKLWFALSGVFLATGDARLRRAALRGVGSIGVASLLANQVGKRAVPRRRPLLDDVPLHRVAHYVPISSSFPSGHSASAAAFAVGATVEFPLLAVPLGALAGAVAFSRVHTGVHFTSDVLAGVALGATVAGAGAVAVPARSGDPSRSGAEPRRQEPPRPTGLGVVAVINPQSGRDGGEQVIAQLVAALPDAEFVEVGSDEEVAEVLRSAAGRAEVLAVIGGDGTINSAAQAAMSADIPLLVIPAGTFNHFAADLELCTVDDAIDAVRAGRAVRIDVGEADGKPFLNTASLGSYPEFVKVRERWQDRLGKPLAAAVAMMTVLRTSPPLAAEVNGISRRLVLLFVGNGDYEPRGFIPRWRRRLDSGRLDVRLVDAARGGYTWRLLAGALTADLYKSDSYVEVRCPELHVKIAGDSGHLARDGEIEAAPAEVRFSVRRQALTVFRPAAKGKAQRRRS
jgi:undecaprenyl-diphosphatase